MNTVRLTLLDIRELQPKAEDILRGLPEELQKKALLYRKEDDQLRSIGSSFLLLKAAKGREIHYTATGKPSPAIITSTFRTVGIMLYLLKPIHLLG